jgi:hypothetical protein
MNKFVQSVLPGIHTESVQCRSATQHQVTHCPRGFEQCRVVAPVPVSLSLSLSLRHYSTVGHCVAVCAALLRGWVLSTFITWPGLDPVLQEVYIDVRSAVAYHRIITRSQLTCSPFARY